MRKIWVCGVVALAAGAFSGAEEPESASDPAIFNPIDVFDLEYASDPQLSPDGYRIVYERRFFDIMKDAPRSNLWTIGFDGSEHRPLTTGNASHSSPRWSPDGGRVAYVSAEDGSAQLYVRWMDTGQTAKVTNLTESPDSLDWSPDGTWLAFTMRVPATSTPMATLPAKPEGAEWAEPAKVVDKFVYRRDGSGYVKDGFTHVFIVPAEGGHPRQLTSGDYDHRGPLSWTGDGQGIVFSANRRDDWERTPQNSVVYRVEVSTGAIVALTDRDGPDESPQVSPDGRLIAYTGFDDTRKSYQVSNLYVMNVDGSEKRQITSNFDRNIGNVRWSSISDGLYFLYSEEGNTKVGLTTLDGEIQTLARDVGGTSLGRPYASGALAVGPNGRYVFTRSRPERPADLATGTVGSNEVKTITALNEDLLGHKTLGAVEEFRAPSTFDGRNIHGWIVKPPRFDPMQKYPMILEIHGGPHTDYGDRFSAEMQLYASAGYVVLYVNPRGSTSYGEVFANLIHHNYPSQDYDDLMTMVDALIRRGYVDSERLYVTGGSGGGVLSAWIVGKTDRFAAAVVAKPVINWYSFVLTADAYNYFYQYWFPGPPWEHEAHYMARSPISLVGNVTTPTMLLTGEQDYRTPISETEQYYQALKIVGVETAMVRIPEASHGIAARPSYLISKVAHVLAWFEKHAPDGAEDASGG